MSPSLLHCEQTHRILRFGRHSSLYKKQRTLRASILHVYSYSFVLPVSPYQLSATECSRYTAQTELRSPYCNDTMHSAITGVTMMAANVTSRASVLAMLHFVHGNTYIHTYIHTHVHTYTYIHIYARTFIHMWYIHKYIHTRTYTFIHK